MPFRLAVLAVVLVSTSSWTAVASAQTSGPALESQFAQNTDDELDEPLRRYQVQPTSEPRRHNRVQNPAALSAEEALAIYRDLAGGMARTYGLSGDPVTAGYRDWRRFNTMPYKSMTHGRRYVNNYANDIAVAYGRYEQAGRLPTGAVIAKDSFVVTDDGSVSAGPLFVMEKMAQGFNYVTGDWRYSMISAEGEFIGRTNGPGAERVEFCISCHLAVENQDHLFFVPQEVRLAP